MVQNDAAVSLAFSPDLYGRDHELASLVDAFAQVSLGQGLVLLVPGRSGAGKTVLVQAVRQPVLKRNGFFLEGKFNQYQQDIPLFAFRQALGQLGRQLLSADRAEQQRWKAEAAGRATVESC